MKGNTTRYFAVSLILAALVVVLTGCAAVHTSIAKRHLDVQTRMSDAVFLDPVSPDKRTVFVQVRNTSDKPNFELEGPVRSAISAKGYQVLDDPEAAHFMLQAQILSVSRASVTAAESALQGGYGAPLTGLLAGATAGVATGGSSQNMAVAGVAGAVVGGLVETVVNAAVQDVLFVAITDVQLSQKAPAGVTGQRDLQVDASQGIGGSEITTFSEVTNAKRYRTRVMSTANKVNLKYEEAAPELNAGLTRVLAGLF
jgi:hypothetical protein